MIIGHWRLFDIALFGVCLIWMGIAGAPSWAFALLSVCGCRFHSFATSAEIASLREYVGDRFLDVNVKLSKLRERRGL